MIPDTRKNRFDNDSCLERGDDAELVFKIIAIRGGWNTIEATPQQNISEHWDYAIQKDDATYLVEVKAMKKISRRNPNPQDKWTWIELHGVRPYDEGWLIGGKSDIIAFEKKDSFLLVKRSDLLNIVPQIVDFQSFVTIPDQAQYKIYQRAGRPDKITLIEVSQLERIRWDNWVK
jgi:hypothetical protein